MVESHSLAVRTSVSSMRVSAVCISRNPETWDVSDVPFHNHTEGWKPFQHEQTTERVAYLAERRNVAVARALHLYPETQHILMIDSYYLHQRTEILGLINEYHRLIAMEPRGIILGASTWIDDRTRIWPRKHFFDGWTTPEANKITLEHALSNGGVLSVKAGGGCYLYPRRVWEQVGYRVQADLHGCEHNWLCEGSGLPVFLTLNEALWHDKVVYPWQIRIRCSLHLGRVKGRTAKNKA